LCAVAVFREEREGRALFGNSAILGHLECLKESERV
jgi:hypothetical protein